VLVVTPEVVSTLRVKTTFCFNAWSIPTTRERTTRRHISLRCIPLLPGFWNFAVKEIPCSLFAAMENQQHTS
jgi:hypothetical protein